MADYIFYIGKVWVWIVGQWIGHMIFLLNEVCSIFSIYYGIEDLDGVGGKLF